MAPVVAIRGYHVWASNGVTGPACPGRSRPAPGDWLRRLTSLAIGLVAGLTSFFGTLTAAETSPNVVAGRREVAQFYDEFLLDRPATDVDARAAEALPQLAERTDDVERLTALTRAMRELFRPQRQAYPSP
jgi:hypothetical protein